MLTLKYINKNLQPLFLKYFFYFGVTELTFRNLLQAVGQTPVSSQWNNRDEVKRLQVTSHTTPFQNMYFRKYILLITNMYIA